ncbi:uncharacterized protein LOC142475233 isoform X1 [Ascaphus truei]|uniref:uncharacterized protein LOC142475233 isoform X1 n=1 Tax=Ascaphus truei TaxID=8439 RepID=UPI003F593051
MLFTKDIQTKRYKEMVSEKRRQEALEREEEHKWRHDNSDGMQKAEEEEKGGRRQNEVGQGEAEVMPEESLESKEKLTEYKEMVSEKSRQEALEREEEHKWRHDNSDGVQKAEEEEKGGRRQNEVGQGEAAVMPEEENPGESLESKEKLTEYKEMVSEKSRQEALEREEEHKWRHDNSDGVQKAEEEEKGGRRQNEVGQGEAKVMPEKENPGESLESKEKLTEYKEMVSEKSRQEALEREEEHKWRHDNSDGVQKAEEEEKGGRRQNEVGQGEAAVMPEEENPGESLESKEKLTENKLQRNPSKISEASTIQSSCDLAGGRKNLGNHHFGVHVGDLISETSSVPVVMEMLLEYLEMYGLHTEGIYRKCGAANRMRELKQSLENDPSSVKLDNYPIHVITGILKQWLRELPEPLMTFAQYNEFLRAVELPGKQEQLCAIYKVLGQLPQAHYNTLERLIFHLVKVAVMEDANRMSSNSLAIIFAPCLLRCPANYDLQTTLKEVSKTITCVEMLIKEQMRQYILKIKEIGMMKAAETQALCSLSLLKHNTVSTPKKPCNVMFLWRRQSRSPFCG